MIKSHRPNVLTYFTHRITSATNEALNGVIKGLSKRAYGFRNFQNFRTAAFFDPPNPSASPLHHVRHRHEARMQDHAPPIYRSSAAARHRFESRTVVGRRSGMLAVLGINGLIAPLGFVGWLLRPLLPAWGVDLLGVSLMLVFFAGSALLSFVLLRSRVVLLELVADRLVVEDGRGGSFPVYGARVGPWRSVSGVVCGSALVLTDGARTYRVGGVDHRVEAPPQQEGPMSDDVDVSLPREVFTTLLALVVKVPEAARASPPREVRCRLAHNPSSPAFHFKAMRPWLVTMAVLPLMSGVFSVTNLFKSLIGIYFAGGSTVVVVVGGLALTIARYMRQEALDLELDDQGLRVMDARTRRGLASASYAEVGRVRGRWEIRTRRVAVDYPVIALTVPGYGDISLCVQDQRFHGPASTPAVSAPRFLVGAPDWTLLVQRLGL